MTVLESYFRKAILLLIIISAVLALFSSLSNAHFVLYDANLFLLALACILFIFSVIIWLFSWSYLIKKHIKLNFRKSIAAGVASFYGSLTPVQIGAEALRAINLKKIYGVSYSESISASMVAKGAKFFVIGIFAGLLLFFYVLGSKADLPLMLSYSSGFFVIALACLLFLLPMNKKTGLAMAKLFKSISEIKPLHMQFLSKLSGFFESYSEYLSRTSLTTLAIVFMLCLFSWFLEIAALYFSFASLSIYLPLQQIFIFATLVAVLERNPILPRGIGLVEVIGYYFLAMPSLLGGVALKSAEIVAALIVYDFVRLILPTIASIAVSYPLLEMLEKQESRKSS